MEAIKINVNKQMDGYTFSISPSIRQLIRTWFPNSHPANRIFVAYDTKSDFEVYYGKLGNYIYPALLGIDNQTDLNKRVDEILFVDTQTGNVLHSHKVTALALVERGRILRSSIAWHPRCVHTRGSQ